MTRTIDCPEQMIAAIRRFGIIPFFKGVVPGWSIEELTAEGCWFADSEEFGGTLGPWDWKIECVREGDIAYGKFLGGKAAFATVEYYRHLMNWRRSLPRYRMALAEPFDARTKTDSLMQVLSPIALRAIKDAGALEARELRLACESAAPQVEMRKSLMDNVLQFLQMGTWSVIGDFRRVYRGPELSYSGWQRASNTTPEALFGEDGREGEDVPRWAERFMEDSAARTLDADCSPQESREVLIDNVLRLFPDASEVSLLKIF